MKYILILLTIMSFTFGQEATINAKGEFVIPPEFFAPEYLKKHMVLTQTITIGMVLEYAEECYNDSTEDSYVRVLDSAEIIYFNHRKPTFERFIKWLEIR